MKDPKTTVGQDLLQLISELDEFKGKWLALRILSQERLQELRKVATVESVGSSTRIEWAKLSDAQVATLLSNLTSSSFKSLPRMQRGMKSALYSRQLRHWIHLEKWKNWLNEQPRQLMSHQCTRC